VSPFEISPRPGLDSVRRLLAAERLPTMDLRAVQLDRFFFAGPRTAPAGIVGLELFTDVALLRSLVVRPAARGRGIGEALVRHAEGYAALQGVQHLYLLTITAQEFFKRLGFQPTTRAEAPAAIQKTREFADLCPASAAFLLKRLQGNET
jgi:amino-acid N-acetyltransferase